MKKVTSIILSVLILSSLLSIFGAPIVSAKSLKKYQYEDFLYVINGDKISLTNYLGDDEVVTVPSEINGMPVTKIDLRAFRRKRTIKKVILPETITDVNGGCFKGATNIKAIKINKKNENYYSVNGIIFSKSNSLIYYPPAKKGTKYTVPDGIDKIGHCAFCKSELESITLPESVTTIDSWAFQGCKKLKTINIPEAVTEIDMHAFKNCRKLESVVIPEGVKELGLDTFKNCYSLKNIKLPSTLENIDIFCFDDCTSLEEIEIPQKITSLRGCFSGCKSLKKITFHDTFKTIGDFTFFNCDGLKKVVLPKSAEFIGERAFINCDNLKSVILNEGLEEIREYAFYNCPNLKSVTIPASVEKIQEQAFGYTGEFSISPYSEVNNPDFIIYGNSGSVAEKYAKKWDLTFKNSDGTPYVKANSTYQKAVGKKFNFKKHIQDADTIKYKSNNQTVATVTADSIVTFKATGKVKIKVKATNEYGTTIKKVKFKIIN